MALKETQVPQKYKEILEAECEIFKEKISITTRNEIPDTKNIPIEKPNYWLKIPNVICVFVDMKGSTLLSANNHDKSTASCYRLFTGTAIKLFHEFNAPYIDIKGDGVFALFNSNTPHTALAAAVTFKTFAKEEIIPKLKKQSKQDIGTHLGIDQKTVLVRKLGLKQVEGRTDRQNEVWAGKPINMAAKLASLSENDELLISSRFFKNIITKKALTSCGCPKENEVDLWSEIDLSSDERFDFDKGYKLSSIWCKEHGKEFCEEIIKADEN